MANLFQVKHKVFEPNKPFVKFKPATTTSLVGAKNKAEAIAKATRNIKELVKAQFPTADIKLLDCKPINYTYFFQ